MPIVSFRGPPTSLYSDHPIGRSGANEIQQRLIDRLTIKADENGCDEDCMRCSGEYCEKHNIRPCDCDSFDRHLDENGRFVKHKQS